MLEAFSFSHGKASAYLPVVDLLQDYFRIADRDDERTRREKVTGKVLALDRALEETLPHLFALLGIPSGDAGLDGMDPSIRRRRTREAVKSLIVRESLNQPLIAYFRGPALGRRGVRSAVATARRLARHGANSDDG